MISSVQSQSCPTLCDPPSHIAMNMFYVILLLTKYICYQSVSLFSHSVMSDSLQPHWLQHSRPPCPSPNPRVYLNLCLLSQWCHPTISSSAVPFSSCLNLSQHQGLLKWVNSSHQVAKVLEYQLQYQSLQWALRTDLL